MQRGCVGSGLAIVLLCGAIAGQTPEAIADAIGRLDGPREDARALEFLIDAGRPAVEPLVAALHSALEDPAFPAYGRMVRALRVLRAIGPEAAAALPTLVDLLVDDRLRGQKFAQLVRQQLSPTVRRLSMVAPESASELRSFLVDQWSGPSSANVSGRNYVGLIRRFELLAAWHEDGTSAPAIDSSDIFERQLALDLLDAKDRAALPHVVAILRDDEQPRQTAESARLPGWDPYSQPVANHLVWESARRAVARIAPEHPEAMRALALMVQSAADPRDRVQAAMDLGRHGKAAEDHVMLFLAALQSGDDRLVAESVTALGTVGVANDLVLVRVRELVDDPRPEIARRAEAALRSLKKRDG